MPKLTSDEAEEVINTEEKEFEALPAGIYWMSLEQVTEKEGKAAPYWEWVFAFLENDSGEEVSGKLYENTSLSPKARFRLKAMFDGFGVDPNTDTDELLGTCVWVRVGTEVARQGARQGKLRNVFLEVIPGDEDGDDDVEAD